ncbi:uncharacterized protein LOC131163552 [Malania oleifera]|uniref:uncharacterized protein LOC131163552 n=1 Tax=Malania oleifera TaxID=397392 RepID=UPI0025AE4269|nr:uncharacterized protein LOC131163552 [Malania oleifera]
MLNGSNFKNWKENVMIVSGCIDLNLALWIERPLALTDTSTSDMKRDLERWECSNRISLMIMKRSVPEAFSGTMSDEDNAKVFLEKLKKRFTKNENAQTNNLLTSLISMTYKEKRSYQGIHYGITSKLKTLKLELSDDLLMHLVLISLPAQYNKFTVSYNTQKDKWTLNELIAHCVQEEEMIK